MHKILVIGGYGVFGKRICERLCRIPDIELVIAGRSVEKAQSLVEQLKNAECKLSAKAIDINNIQNTDLGNVFALINASGPYHEQDYSVAEYCIENGVHYIDLADNREFVKGIAALDKTAKAKDVFVVSGASTVPALSSAVVDHFQEQFSEIHALDYGVTPGNQTDRGVGTVAAILSYVGKPFKTLIDGTSQRVYGWQNLHRTHYPAIGKRYMSNCDIPDLDLFQSRYPDLKTQRFYAGLELGILHVGLWFLSWPSRWSWIKHPEKLAGVLRQVSLWFYPLGSDKGGMHVKIEGLDQDNKPLQTEWYLIADEGDGPYIPATPSVIIIKKLLNGSLKERGAVPCMGLFTLQEFMDEVCDLNIAQYTDEPLYVRYLKERYVQLPQAVQDLHNFDKEATYIGECNVQRGANPFCKFVAWMMSLPPQGQGHKLKVHFKREGGAEHWTRHFGDKTFYSKQWDEGGTLYEQVNITTLAFDIDVSKEKLSLKLKQVYTLGIPVGWLFKPKVIAEESEQSGKFRVNVEVHLLVFGLLVKYSGWLEKA
ncbi:MAG: DUF4166 domain-containing protein [Alphaproteobacteria bacterium]